MALDSIVGFYETMKYEDIKEAMEILELPNMVTKEELKKRYKELARRYHPDRLGGDSSQMEKINRAYELLVEYMDGFRYALDEDEFYKRYPQSSHSGKFRI